MSESQGYLSAAGKEERCSSRGWECELKAHLYVMRDVSVKETWLGLGLGPCRVRAIGPELGLRLERGF